MPNANCFLRGDTTVHQIDESSKDSNQKNALQNIEHWFNLITVLGTLTYKLMQWGTDYMEQGNKSLFFAFILISVKFI